MKTIVLPRAVQTAVIVALLLLGASFAFAEESTSTEPITNEAISESAATTSDIFILNEGGDSLIPVITLIEGETNTSTDAFAEADLPEEVAGTSSPEPSSAAETPTEAATTSGTEATAVVIPQNPELSTDKEEYHPEEVATIFGRFFSSLQDVILKIFAGSEEEGTYIEDNRTVTTDAEGSFSTEYTLGGLAHEFYTVIASAINGETLAEMTFVDPPSVDFKQCANKNPTLGTCDWIGSILQANNSQYYEGMSVPQRLLYRGLGNGSHTVSFDYSYTKGGIHAYDFITGKNQGNPTITTFNNCGGLNGPDLTACNALVGIAPVMISVPTDTFDSKDSAPAAGTGSTQAAKEAAYEVTFGDRQITLHSQGTFSAPSISPITHSVGANGDTADSDASMAITFTLSGCNQGCNIMLYFGGHLAVSGSNNTSGSNWGSGLGSSAISGGPYHIKGVQLDGVGGSLDNQIQGSNILIPNNASITIVKDASPDSAQDFSFTTTGTGLSPFSLDDDLNGTLLNTQTFNGLAPGAYTVTEGVVSGWSLTGNLTCVDPTSNSAIVLNTRTATINLAAGENVTCTFVNTLQQGSIRIVKNTVGGNGTFNFTGTTGVTSLTTSAGTANQTVNVNAGTYNIAETVPTGWDLTSATCDNSSTPANITVTAGQTTTCTFTNTKKGQLTVQKTTVPAGDTTSFSIVASGSGTITGGGAGTITDATDKVYEVTPGTYSVAETVPTGWVKTGDTCQNIAVAAGESKTCLITNTKNGFITIEKQVVGTDKSFTFSGAFAATLSDNLTATLPVVPGNYSVTEGADSAYALTSLTCSGNDSTGSTNTRTASFVVGAGEDVTCVFTNSELPKLTLVKTVSNDNGGTAVTTSFQGKINGNNVPWGSAQTLTAGSFTASETNLPNYTASSWGDDCAADGSITLAYGDSKTCTITNSDNAPSLTLVKEVVNDNGGTAVAANWTLTAAGYDSASPDAGTYNLSESGPTGYAQTSLTCSNSGAAQVTSVTLGLGEQVTCTFVNNDQPGTLIVKKILTQDDGGDEAVTSFTFKVNDGNAVAFETDAQNDLTVNAGTYSVTEPAVTGYTTTYDNCSNVVIPNGGTATCTIANNDQPGTLKVTKITDPVSDTTTQFDITAAVSGEGEVQGVAAQTIVGGQTVTYTVDEGVYDVAEADETGWVETANTCNDVVVPNGGEGSCTITNVKQGSITIEKQTLPDGSTADFTFTGDVSETLSDGDTATPVSVAPGTYSSTEGILAGWDLTNITCDDANSTGNVGTRVVIFNVAAGENVKCTFTNTQRAYIIIVKDVIGNPDPTDFTFNNNFGLNHPATFMLDEDTNATLPSSRDFEVLSGTYAVSEDPVAGWQSPESTSCTNGETIESIDVVPGETVTCTFVNEKLVSITLIKNTLGGNGDFDFDGTGAGLPTDIDLTTVDGIASQTFTGLDQDDTFSITENLPTGWELVSAVCSGDEVPSNITPEPNENVTCTFTNGKLPTLTLEKTVVNDHGGTATEASFTPSIDTTATTWDTPVTLTVGAHAASETTLDTYTASAWGGDCALNGTITLTYGENKTCSITNDDKPGTLIVKKVVVNNNGGSATADTFTFKVNEGTITAFEADGQNDLTVSAGTYSVLEPAVAGYTTTYNNCSNLVIPNGGTATCTVTNDDQQAFITVTKVVTNDNGGSAAPNNFLLTLEGNAVSSGVAVPVNPGTYTAAETQLSGYTFEGFTGACDQNGDVTVALGESKSCTLTNNDQQAFLIIDKTVVNDNGGTAGPDAFNLTIDAAATLDGASVPVNPGQHQAGETLLAGYSASVWGGDCNAAGSVTIALGQTKTCTITNNDIAPILHLRKVVVNDNGGIAALANFTLTANGTGANDISGTSPVDAGATLQADTFTLSETNVSGYSASDWVCVGGAQNAATVSLGIGQEATCTITNDDDAPSLTLVKQVTNDNGGTAVAADFALTATGYNAVSPDAGTYALSETGPTGYTQTSLTCSNAQGEVTSATLALGENVTCTFVNNDNAPALTLNKIVVNNNGGTAAESVWNLTATGAGGTPTNLSGPGAAGSVDVVSGSTFKADTYTLAETGGPTGYTASAWTCTNSVVVTNNQITLGLGQSTVCSITNDDQPARLIVIKHVINDNGDIAAASGFTMHLTGTNLSQNNFAGSETGVTVTLNAGTYTADEINNAGYTKTLSADCSGTIAVGQTKTCTITNNDRASATRTQGFWKTHTAYTTQVLGTNTFTIGTRVINSPAKLFAGFYASIPKTSTGGKRSALDQARMQLLQQWLAAKLNCQAFGCSTTTQTLVNNAATAFADTNQTLIKSYATQLDAYNNSNDALPISAQGKATPQTSQSTASTQLSFWNTLP